MSEYKIDKNVPIPSARGGAGLAKYPFSDMEVGDSFFTPGEINANRVSTAAQRYKKDHPGTKFTLRRCRENDVNGVRCWRVK